MDGNGRWAVARRRPRSAGHRAGAEAVRRVVRAAPGEGISLLTLYAFSADNWQRPRREVEALLRLFHRFLRSEVESCRRNGVRLTVIGRRDRLPQTLRAAIAQGERDTAGGSRLHLRIAIDYSARDAIVAAAARLDRSPTREHLAQALGEAMHDRGPAPDVDLLIRTGGEQRLSDFLLWECAYAELYFTPVLWPDFGEGDLRIALQAFQARERRFGALPHPAAG